MKARMTALALMAAAPLPAQADAAKDFSADLGKVVGAFTATRLYVEQCNVRDPAKAAARRDALAGWAYGNEQASYERLMQALYAKLPKLSAQIDPQRTRIADVVAQDLQNNPAQCDVLHKVFRDNDQFKVRSQVRRLMRSASRLGVEIPPAPTVTPGKKRAEDTQILRLAALSARLEAKMSEIGSKDGARRNSDLSRAREEHALNWLIADGVQVVFGRVTDHDEMREWRGDQQSTFKIECDTFFNDAHKSRMAEAKGQDRVVIGTPRSLFDTATGGRLKLRQCSIFTPEETGRPFANQNDDAGLMPRPMEEHEAYAGPNAGIRLRDVDRVLYDARFNNRMDGFGNGYIDRNEDIYVLMRDGTAYRHDWSFPFTDLAIERSKKREPDRWFSWSERGGRVSLLRSDDKTKIIKLEKAQRLTSMKPKALAANYHYLQIGMGGARQDRRYVFSDDGTVTYSRSGFVAGNVATSYIIVNGRKQPDVTARYRFEDYALILERDGETERHFFAVPASADLAAPDTVLIRGQAYWRK